MREHDDEGEVEAGSNRKYDIDPPQHPSERGGAVTPRRHAYEDCHVEDGGESHWDRTKKQRLDWVGYHMSEEAWKHGVAEYRYEEEGDEQQYVETEDHN